jgi:hypothetical protein
MLSGEHFYYRTIRRNVIAFGTLFKDLQLVTYTNDASRTELKRIRVPLMYGDKEDYYIRLKAAGVVPIPTDLPLPRMMFRMDRLYYDAQRKQQSQLQTFAGAGLGLINAQYVPVPYNIDFVLEVYVRNTEDGTQIIEQILPWFTPDFTLEMVFVDQLGLTKKVPIVLNAVNRSLENEGATDWTMRREVWTLNFTMQSFIFGPTQGAGLIQQANTNIWYYAGAQESGQALNMTLSGPGFQSYKIGEVIYQGNSLDQATAVGYVQQFYPNSNSLSIYIQTGTFIANANVKGAVTQASWNVAAIANNKALATVSVTGVPATVNIGDDFGFAVTIKETPNT